MKISRKTKYISLAVVLIIAAALVGSSLYFLDFALNNEDRNYSEKAAWEQFYERHPDLKQWADSIRGISTSGNNDAPLKKAWITNADGDSIRVYYLPARNQTMRTAVLAHGYTDCGISMMHIAYMYNHDLGYNVVTYDQYAHGESEGKMIQMGWKDRKNLIQCARLAYKMYGDSIVMHGISMGGATVMMASGDETLPHYVRAVVDDCGYTSVWDEFSGELKNQFSLPAFPLLHVTSGMCKLLNGWSFGEASALDMVSEAKVPMLFIHGGNDDYVPTAMVHPLYEACPSKHKSLWIAPNSTHAQSYKDHPKEYTEKVREFLTSLP